MVELCGNVYEYIDIKNVSEFENFVKMEYDMMDNDSIKKRNQTAFYLVRDFRYNYSRCIPYKANSAGEATEMYLKEHNEENYKLERFICHIDFSRKTNPDIVTTRIKRDGKTMHTYYTLKKG